MATSTKRVYAQLEAVTAKWGKTHIRKFTVVPNTAFDPNTGALDGKFLPINYMKPDLTEVQGYIWFADTNNRYTDPAPPGYTLIGAVAIQTGDPATQVAAKIKATLDAALIPGTTIKAFRPSTVSSHDITVENKFIGEIAEERDAEATGISNQVIRAGVGLDLGATSEAVELSFETQTVDITSNQTGGIISSQIYIGSSASISMSLLELTKERFDLLVGEVTGDSVSPNSGTKIAGYGESRLFQSLDDLGGQLIVHPIRLPISDRSSDVIFWKCAPKPSSLNFDGQSPQVMAVEFTAYLDQTKSAAINLFAKGDWAQEGLDA